MAARLQNQRARIWFLLRLLVSAALVVWLVLEFDWQATWQALGRISLLGIAVLILGLLLNRLLAFYRFWVLLRSEEVAISLGTIMRVSFLATFASHFLPTTVGGDVAKVGWLASKGYSAWRMAIWTLFDRLANMLAVGLLAPFCLLLPAMRVSAARFFGGWPDSDGNVFWLAVLLFALLSLATGLVLGLTPNRQRVTLRMPANAPQAAGPLSKARTLWKELLARKRMFWILTLISMLSIIPNLIGTWLAALDLGIQVNVWEVTAIYVVLYFITLLPVSLNGLGLQEVSTVALYMSLGANEPQAAALAILLRFAIWITTLPGWYWLSRGITDHNPVQGQATAHAQPIPELPAQPERNTSKVPESE